MSLPFGEGLARRQESKKASWHLRDGVGIDKEWGTRSVPFGTQMRECPKSGRVC